jgi:hypothetical protein
MISLPTRSDLRDVGALAAAFSNLDVEIVDGVFGADIENRTLPNGALDYGFKYGELGNWRAHMNVARL